MTDLEHRLLDLAAHLDAPTGETIPAAVTARLAATGGETARGRRRWWRWIAGAVIAGAGVGAAPALADWLGVGGVEISREPAPPARTVPSVPGRTVALEDVPGVAGFDPILPDGLGEPDEVRVDDRAGVAVVWLHWEGGPLLAELDGTLSADPVLRKHAPDATIEEVVVDGHRAVWVEGRHEIVIAGVPVPPARRTAEGTLLLEIGSITIRIETDEGRREAIRIARSLAGT